MECACLVEEIPGKHEMKKEEEKRRTISYVPLIWAHIV